MHFVLLRITRRMWPELETMVPPDRRHGLADVPGVIVRLPFAVLGLPGCSRPPRSPCGGPRCSTSTGTVNVRRDLERWAGFMRYASHDHEGVSANVYVEQDRPPA